MPVTANAPELLQLEQASKTYRRNAKTIQALKNFDLEVAPGTIVGLLGPNGSGKTTLIKVITGLCGADQGSLRWRDQAAQLAGQPGPHLREMGVLLEGRGAVYERLSTWENARYYCALREARFDADEFRRLAELLDVADIRAPVRQLSTGNKLRAALLGALIHRPALVLLDEPTLGLDLQGVERLQAVLRQGAAQGQAFILSSHDLHFIERLCPRIVCIHAGEKRFDGLRSDFVQQQYSYRLIVQFGSSAVPEPPPWLPDRCWVAQNDQHVLDLSDHAEACRLLAEWQPLLPHFASLELRRVELRDHYLQMLESGSVA
ncbi:MAG: ABC transporter ATP-binding protein [Pseudomarimonas sp.]